MVRPLPLRVQCPRSGHDAHARPNDALPMPSRPRRIGTVWPAGQVTESASRSTSNSSLANIPSAAHGRGVLHLRIEAGILEPLVELAGAVGVVTVDRRPLLVGGLTG